MSEKTVGINCNEKIKRRNTDYYDYVSDSEIPMTPTIINYNITKCNDNNIDKNRQIFYSLYLIFDCRYTISF